MQVGLTKRTSPARGKLPAPDSAPAMHLAHIAHFEIVGRNSPHNTNPFGIKNAESLSDSAVPLPINGDLNVPISNRSRATVLGARTRSAAANSRGLAVDLRARLVALHGSWDWPAPLGSSSRLRTPANRPVRQAVIWWEVHQLRVGMAFADEAPSPELLRRFASGTRPGQASAARRASGNRARPWLPFAGSWFSRRYSFSPMGSAAPTPVSPACWEMRNSRPGTPSGGRTAW